MIHKTIIFSVISFLHFLVTFICWSFAPGNAAVDSPQVISVFWQVFSFPLITFMPRVFDNVFMPILFINSCVWGLVILILFSAFIKRNNSNCSNNT